LPYESDILTIAIDETASLPNFYDAQPRASMPQNIDDYRRTDGFAIARTLMSRVLRSTIKDSGSLSRYSADAASFT